VTTVADCSTVPIEVTLLCIYAEIDGLDPQKREMLEARITGRVSCHSIGD